MNNNEKRRLQVIGEKMKSLRRNANMTQAELALLLGVNFRTISNYEKSVLLPRADVILKYCSFFSVRPDDLLGYNDLSGKERSVQKSTDRRNREESSPKLLLVEMNRLMVRLKKSIVFDEKEQLCKDGGLSETMMPPGKEHGGQKSERNQC